MVIANEALPNTDENISRKYSLGVKGCLIQFYDQSKERDEGSEWEQGVCNQEPGAFYFPSPKPLPSISSFPIFTATLLLKGLITPWLGNCQPFLLFLLKHSLDCIPRPLTDLRLLPYYLSKCNVLASGALGNLTPNCFPTLGSHFSSQRISCYLHTQILHRLQISHLLVC